MDVVAVLVVVCVRRLVVGLDQQWWGTDNRGEPSSLSLYRWSSAWSHFLTQATLVPHGVLKVDVWLDACVLKPLLGY